MPHTYHKLHAPCLMPEIHPVKLEVQNRLGNRRQPNPLTPLWKGFIASPNISRYYRTRRFLHNHTYTTFRRLQRTIWTSRSLWKHRNRLTPPLTRNRKLQRPNITRTPCHRNTPHMIHPPLTKARFP